VNTASNDALESVRFVLLMRHAKHQPARMAAMERSEDNVNVSDRSTPARELSSEGKEETKAVAERLKEHIKQWRVSISLAGMIGAGSDEAKATAEAVQVVFPELNLETADLLTPEIAFAEDSFKRDGASGLAQKIKSELGRTVTHSLPNPNEGSAILIVGHQPILGWLTYEIVGDAYPLAHSEVLCLDRHELPPACLCWTISPSNPEAVLELKEKIRSKMDVAKLLSSFLGAGLSFLLGTMVNSVAVRELGGHMVAFAIGSFGLLAALALFLWTMCSYDTLLMPHRMWSETPVGVKARPAWLVERPPSPVHWILYQNMIRVWQWQFLPATALMLAGLWLLASAVFGARVIHSARFAAAYYVSLSALAMTVIIVKAWRHRRAFQSAMVCPGVTNKLRHLSGPWLGSED